MNRDMQSLDSYQNLICSPVENESIEAVVDPTDSSDHAEGAVDGYQGTAAIYAADGIWDTEEDSERLAGDLSSDRAEGDRRRRAPAGHDSGDRNEPEYADEGEAAKEGEPGRGRAASGESYEDEADNALFRP